MTSNANPADGDGLSVDQAAELLGGAPLEGETAEAASADDDVEAAEDAGEAEEADAGDEIKPPHSWDAEAKARFRELPPDVQALIAEREGERDRATSRTMQEAAEARKRADAEASEALEMTAALDALLPQAAQTFAGRWDGVDWQAWAEADPQGALQGRAQFEAEQGELHRLDAVRRQAEAANHERYVAGEARRLKLIAPELADPKAGAQRRQELGRFLLEQGASAEQLAGLSAVEAALAYDAMQWRRAKEGLAAGPARMGEGAERRTVRPTAAQAPRSSQQRQASDALARLSRSGSVDDAVAYLRSKG